MSETSAALALRAKILGALLHDARKTKGRSIQACAEAIGITVEKYQAFESGNQAPSMPDLEGIAYFLEIPIEHFWSNRPLENQHKALTDIERLKQIRQRIIGATLRNARLEANLSIEQFSQQSNLEEDKLVLYELGQSLIPVPELEILSEKLNLSVKDFIDQKGPVGIWINQQTALSQFLDMPEDLQSFVSQPVNRPYLDLAQRLSKMSVEKLRSVAEVLLEITY